MSYRFGVPFWKRAPFIRLLVPLIAGIIMQWYIQFPLTTIFKITVSSLLLLLLSSLFPLFVRFRYGWLTGAVIFLLFTSAGCFLAYYKDIRKNKIWLAHYYHSGDEVKVTIQEPLTEKANSYKTIVSVQEVVEDSISVPVNGKVIVYFKKNSDVAELTYGSQIVFHQPLQQIKNAGNPGGFDYERYCLFKGITHQIYLKSGDFILIANKKENWLDKLLFFIQDKTIGILRANIRQNKEQGLAEALLIGYKDDLDKTLVQSYTNTGVVHIIAISGQHLALIYWVLLQLIKPLKKRKGFQWLPPVIIVAVLWLFSLVTGAQPSILRAAVMFTIIVLAENFSRRSNILNSLAASAFILLCFDPFMLWDVGFQLSYAALLSLAVFFKPIRNWFYFENRSLAFIWDLLAASIAAQILTAPISIYHFHQFPFSFLLTNFIAVPLSSLIVIGELFLCALSFITPVALVVGKVITVLIWLMNSWVENVEAIPASLWDGLQISVAQTILLYAGIAGFAYWLLEKYKPGMWMGLACLSLFFACKSISFVEANKQQKLIVYNVARQNAIDIIEGRKYVFIGDSALLEDDFLRNFNLKPSRILYRISAAENLPGVLVLGNYISWHNKKIIIIDKSIEFASTQTKLPIDLLIISKNADPSFKNLNNVFVIREVVFDGSLPAWKVNNWKAECDSLGLHYHDVSEDGAYIMNN